MATSDGHAEGRGKGLVRTTGERRRRRTREEARQEILDAAGRLLARLPAHDVTVAAVMADTTLTRKSFYVYFRDRADLIAALVRPLRADADAALDVWAETLDTGGSPEEIVTAARSALTVAARVYRRHGAVLRALFWSPAEDSELAAVRRALTDPVVAVAERTIRTAAPSLASTAAATATALVAMNVHCLLGLSPDASDAELDDLVDTLTTIWRRTVYAHD
jgi:AcrR family transcriptional regulator